MPTTPFKEEPPSGCQLMPSHIAIFEQFMFPLQNVNVPPTYLSKILKVKLLKVKILKVNQNLFIYLFYFCLQRRCSVHCKRIYKTILAITCIKSVDRRVCSEVIPRVSIPHRNSICSDATGLRKPTPNVKHWCSFLWEKIFSRLKTRFDLKTKKKM